ncbi:uncharacterized protein EV154DRAFT_496921 [Mucor mucedo]|uniref:uncharacterized protein n=1 Tax=Mucor mucedo TaxID=29922 RepID=UPI002220708F|nr:uncharacterized protein EV154DRAFT_496921 [Mucor mucedo]KAI7895088.1 hypothetical protein EV154DRAFT_496921 [Mucor mucedo]
MSPQLTRPRPRSMATWLLKEHLDEGLISLDADYQRDVKWDEDKMCALIDSIFENFYVPPLLFAVRKVNNRNTRMVIDGKQRLTAINKFMTNQFPYIDPESGECKYYSKLQEDEKDEKTYLSNDEIEVFHQFQFVCVEYNGITVDQEYEVFSRVQLGVAITPAEKLKAHNTPIARECRELSSRFIELKGLIARKPTDAVLFQLILHMFLTLKNGTEQFQGQIGFLHQLVTSQYEVPSRHKETVIRTLQTIREITTNKNLKDYLVKRNNRSCLVKTLEVLLFMLFRDKVGRPRSVQAYANDFYELRVFLYAYKMGGKIFMSKEIFMAGVQFVEERIERLDLAPARVIAQDVDDDDDDDDDELKQEEYILQEEEEEEVVIAPIKRRRNGVRHTARRGGKFSGGLPRS